MKENDKIFVTGHRGMVGSALVRGLKAAGFDNVLARGRDELDLLNPVDVIRFLAAERCVYPYDCPEDRLLTGPLEQTNEPYAIAETLLGDPIKAKEKLGWVPKITLPELVKEMVEADYTSARRDSLVKAAGFQAYDYNE